MDQIHEGIDTEWKNKLIINNANHINFQETCSYYKKKSKTTKISTKKSRNSNRTKNTKKANEIFEVSLDDTNDDVEKLESLF